MSMAPITPAPGERGPERSMRNDPRYALPPLPVKKSVRVWLEVVRSACAVVSALGTLLVLARVFGVL